MTTWFAPGRANLMGEHTDYNGGLVLPFALTQGVTATASPRSDGLLALRSKQMPGDLVTVDVAALEPGSVPGWAAYPAGVAWSLALAGFPALGADIDIDSDLPVGAGVSSSAALECSVALALCDLGGVQIARRELAAIARRAENEFVGAPTGMIDQFAALLCEQGHAMLLDCGKAEIRQVPFGPAEAGFVALVIDTKVAHALVSGEYAARRAECEEAARQLGISFLGSLTTLPPLADPVLRRRARHVLTDSARARAMADALDSLPAAETIGVYRFIGEMLTEGHASLRDDFEVSWPEADVTVETALAAGAFGAKMIGGGFGGSVLALVPKERLPAVRAAVTAEFERRSWVGPEFLNAIPSQSARKLALFSVSQGAAFPRGLRPLRPPNPPPVPAVDSGSPGGPPRSSGTLHSSPEPRQVLARCRSLRRAGPTPVATGSRRTPGYQGLLAAARCAGVIAAPRGRHRP
jgi:galactokinase